MSDFVFQGFENFEISGIKKSRKSSKNKTNVIKVFVAIFCILLVCEFLVYMLVIPCMDRVDISWSGLSSYKVQNMQGVIGNSSNKTFLTFSTSDVKSALLTIPGIEDVKVVRRFPNKVYINVLERKPIAMTFISNNGRTQPVCIDKNGVLFTSDVISSDSDKSIPLISGIPVENIPEGMRIPQKYRALMEQIDSIRSLSQNYFAAISEIHVIPKEYGNYELVLYPIQSQTRILTGRQLNEESLQYMIVALDVVNTLEPDVEEIDLRYGSVSYTTRSNAHRRETGVFGE
ncbi:cell division protein FtsQ/DivIB [Treponema sp.]|uniref:cell division protein FtsQ/DivIB n=1 Tax=Treponema sp. TaxID=166 RepID=UPI003890A100